MESLLGGTQLLGGAPACSVHRAVRARELGDVTYFRDEVYNALVPAHTYSEVRALPHVIPLRFTPCGKYFVSLAVNHADLVLYRLEGGDMRANWPRTTGSGSASGAPPLDAAAIKALRTDRRSCTFNRFFTLHYSVPVVTPGESLVPDFCLASARGRFLILASFARAAEDDAQAQGQAPPNAHAHPQGGAGGAAAHLPAVRSCPVLSRFTLYLVEMESGRVYDRMTLENDFVQLDAGAGAGVHMRANQLCVLSLRYQTLHILRVQESVGRFVRELRLGATCYDDDESELARVDPPAAAPDEPHAVDMEAGLGNGKRRDAPYCGLMHRLLAHVYRQYAAEGNAHKFFQVVALYSALLMLRAQLLDADHLLIQLGPEEGGHARNNAGSPSSSANVAHHFLLVYCLSETRVVRLFRNRSTHLVDIYSRHHDDFYPTPMDAAVARPLPNLRPAPRRAQTARRIRRLLAELPVRSASITPSPYLDRTLFSYDVEHAQSRRNSSLVKFSSVRTGVVRFRLGLPAAHAHVCFIVHPTYPFVISIMANGVSRTVAFHTVPM